MRNRAFFLASIMLMCCLADAGLAQVTTNITSSGLGTAVSPISGGVVTITGGTRPGNGPNLFHSFGLFNVGTGDTANFFNNTGLPTTNILSRVTGGSASNIFGTIQTTGFGNANLFLINPAGVVFGPNASLNIGGSFHVSTADYIRLTDNVRFNAKVDAAADALLSSAPVAAFGFLPTNDPGSILAGNPRGGIEVQGSNLAVSDGQTISLVGGDITMTGGTLSTPGGQINLVSAASAGEVLFPGMQYGPNVNGDSFTSMGTINLSGGALVDVSADAAGTIVIRGGQLMIVDATLSADTVSTSGASIAIDINVTGDMLISNDTVSALTARTFGSGDAGEIRISSANLTVASNTFDILTLIDSHTLGTGRAGNVSITTGNLQVTGSLNGFATFIDSGTEGPGHGGDVTINARSVEIDFTLISTGTFLANLFGEEVTGSAGNVTISADSLQSSFSAIVTDAFSFANATGQAGTINISVHDINLDTTQVSSQGFQRGGSITINTDQLTATDSQVITSTNLMPGGAVTVTGRAIELSTGSSMVSSTGGDGDAGSINIIATDHLDLSRATGADRPSGLFSNSFGTFGSAGNSGDIVITTPKLEMTGGARINTTTATSGHGGNVTIHTTDSISMSGETGSFSPEPLFSLGTIQPSGIFTLTIGGNCSGPCGNAGNVSISTGSLTMGSGAQINSGTSSTGQGGNITINAGGTISISGTLSNGQPSGILSRTIGTDPGSGSGGTITLQATQVQLSNGSSVSAQSFGTGNAGNINIMASDSLVMQNSSISTATTQSDGGDIHIQVGRLVQLTDSQITTSVQGGTGNGGNITIDPQFVILQNSQILANAFGGNGGNILIVAGVFLADPFSVVSASSTLGISGTVSIQAPVTGLSGTLAPLSGEIVQAAALLQARCAARFQESQYSSFVQAGRDGLPLEPGGLLPSPLYVESPGSTRLAVVPDVPELRIGRTFVESDLILAPIAIGCSS